MEAPYQVLLLGAETDDRQNLRLLIEAQLVDLGVDETTIRFINESEAGTRERKWPAMAVYFGFEGAADSALLSELIEDSITIAPIVSKLTRATKELPGQLAHINAIERSDDGAGVTRLATLILELFRLLRRERRLFISYKRKDSQPLAEILYDALDARGFDVFIDLRSVPPAIDFQSVLWHRMSDCDVVILIDTPGFRQGRWTTEELARANATNIQILHLLWPGQAEDSTSSLSHFLNLQFRDFWSWLPLRGRFVRRETVRRICDEAERRRASAIAWRYRYLVDSFCDAARDEGLIPAVQPERWILLDTPKMGSLAVVPAVGVPTSDKIHEIFDAVSSRQPAGVWIAYDSRGVLNGWLAHLDWLDAHLPIKTVQMSRVPDRIRELMT